MTFRRRRPTFNMLIALLTVAIALAGGLLSTAAQRPNGAGLVIRHGDETVIYAYIQFDEESINGMDLITRSGIEATLSPFGGMGMGVCSINGEGCPSDNCFCHSYSSPAYFWHYYNLVEGEWVFNPVGPSGRTLRDGDIDGWAWSAGDVDLPPVTIEDIAAQNNIDHFITNEEGEGGPDYLLFAGLLAVALGVGGVAIYRNRAGAG